MLAVITYHMYSNIELLSMGMFVIFQVTHSSAMLSTLPLHAVGYQQPISIEALQQSDSSYTIFMDNLVMDQLVTPCAAIVSLDSSLVNVGDYIEMSSVHDQVCTHESIVF